jgi:hypothetical protein
MRKLLTAVAAAMILLAGAAIMNAEAATPAGTATVPLAQTMPPVQSIGCWCGPYRCACRRRWWGPRYYWGPRRYYRRWRY